MSHFPSCSLVAELPAEANTIVIPLFTGSIQLPAGCPSPVVAAVKDGHAQTKRGVITATYSGSQQWLFVGVGEQEQCTVEFLREIAANVVRFHQVSAGEELAWVLPDCKHLTQEQLVTGLAEGALLSSFRYLQYKSQRQQDDQQLKQLLFVTPNRTKQLVERLERVRQVCVAVNHARELQHGPPNEVNPAYLVRYAQELVSRYDSLTLNVLDRAQMKQREMGCFLAVAAGSETEPALIEITYEPGSVGETDAKHIALVGKGVTFDTGGISLKPPLDMKKMRSDMSGGAAVLGVMESVAALQLPVKLTGIVGAVENIPGPQAMLPGSIVRAANGTTVQIVNTDAEGRLVLADCLDYACKQGAEKIIDIATLTGAVRIALGAHRCGLMSNNDELANQLAAAGERSGELTWRLPLDDAYLDLLKSDDADLMNAVENRMAGTVTAGKFLEQFVEGRPWAHLDIAAAAWDRGVPYAEKGGSGFGVRLLLELIESLAH